ncbi:hypothetical protein [Aeoliella sp.]|uniref:hypothetical protein n=1 Tax=Aeoliella sp. TaxID=2795800 RepID=UPI003CCBEFFB
MFRKRLVRLSVAVCLLLASGCTSWKVPKLDMNRLRDPRAVDIDNRLTGPANVDFKAE